MIDVDYFKRYNDVYGHPAGDECLRLVGAAIRAARWRSSDIQTRYGGEEIAVLLPQTDAAGALAVAERIRRGVEELAIPHTGNPAGCVTVSIGVAAHAPTGAHLEERVLVRYADRALYAAKGAGRNRVCLDDEPDTPR